MRRYGMRMHGIITSGEGEDKVRRFYYSLFLQLQPTI
jgi:hypothetical protein